MFSVRRLLSRARTRSLSSSRSIPALPRRTNVALFSSSSSSSSRASPQPSQQEAEFQVPDPPPQMSEVITPWTKATAAPVEEPSPYPTRLADSKPSMFPRVDPVVHSPEGTPIPEASLLTAEDVAHYDKHGFLVFENALSAAELLELRQEVGKLHDETQQQLVRQGQGDARVTEECHAVTEPGSDAIKSIFEPHKLSEFIGKNVVRLPRILETAKYLLNDDVYVHQSRVNFQSAFTGQGFTAHQDSETWMSEDFMPRMRAVSSVVLLNDNVTHNGALMVVPGSHRFFISTVGETPEKNWESSLRKQVTGVPDHAVQRVLVDSFGIKQLTAPAGSVVFFDCNLLHMSFNNLSPWSRSNVFTVYNAVSNKLKDPPQGKTPRPNHIANRTDFSPLE